VTGFQRVCDPEKRSRIFRGIGVRFISKVRSTLKLKVVEIVQMISVSEYLFTLVRTSTFKHNQLNTGRVSSHDLGGYLANQVLEVPLPPTRLTILDIPVSSIFRS
jgi:hypothetical protein